MSVTNRAIETQSLALISYASEIARGLLLYKQCFMWNQILLECIGLSVVREYRMFLNPKNTVYQRLSLAF
jgi:hypothetical protein